MATALTIELIVTASFVIRAGFMMVGAMGYDTQGVNDALQDNPG
jgi:hypothetical protein